MAYVYHSSKGFALLTLVLLSFVVHTYSFVSFVVVVVVPIFTIDFLFLYFINIPEFIVVQGFKGTYLYTLIGYEYVIPSLEIALMFVTVAFLIMLIPSKPILKITRHDFKKNFFERLSNKNSNFMWQLLFYILKRIHIPILLLVFILGVYEMNIYYIGIMFFFVVFAASLSTYRRAGLLLVCYSAFFIWLQYKFLS